MRPVSSGKIDGHHRNIDILLKDYMMLLRSGKSTGNLFTLCVI
jgi:hypothetical protein